MKYKDNAWNFLNNRYSYSHTIHKYPAKLVPGIVEKILEEYQTDDMELLFEPYVGSGTTLVEANLKGLKCVGTDLNPLARKISKVKTTCLDSQLLESEITSFTCNRDLIEQEMHLDKDFSYPNVTNIEYWFKKENIKQLIPIKNYIVNIKNKDIRDFFEIALSETIREVSLTRNNEFKRYRIPEEKIVEHNREAFGIMLENLLRNQRKIMEFSDYANKSKSIDLYSFNTVEGIPEEILPSNSVDIVITSPPYGDSSSTVAYGQFSRFSNEWLGYDDASGRLDSKLMGGLKSKEEIDFGIKSIDTALKKIKKQSPKRALEITAFYSDYKKSITNISKVIKKGGIAAFVVGNRTVKGQFLETDEFTKQVFEENGFTHLKTIIRTISRKRLPAKIAPTGKEGISVKTMNQEYIVIMQKN